MPHLQFDLNFEVAAHGTGQFAIEMAELYVEWVDADTDYAAISVRGARAAHLGRAIGDKIVALQADIRVGRTADRKRDLVLAVIEIVTERFDMPGSSQKVVFTEREGSQIVDCDRVGDD